MAKRRIISEVNRNVKTFVGIMEMKLINERKRIQMPVTWKGAIVGCAQQHFEGTTLIRDPKLVRNLFMEDAVRPEIILSQQKIVPITVSTNRIPAKSMEI